MDKKKTETVGWPISKFEFQKDSFQFDINTDRLLEFIADQKGNITGFNIERETKDVTPKGPGVKWKENRFTGRKIITIEIFESPREKRPSESPSKTQTQPRPDPSVGGKSTNEERCTECGNKTEREGQDPFYFGDTGPLCDGCHDNMKSRFLENWPNWPKG